MTDKSLELSGVSNKQAFLGKITTAIRNMAVQLCANDEEVFDVGCGNGIFFAQLCKSSKKVRRFIGLDYSEYLLNEAKTILSDNNVNGTILIRGDIFSLPLKSGRFKRITCLNTILNIPTVEKVENLLAGLINICSQNGKIVIDVRNKYNPVIKLKYWRHSRKAEFATIAYSLDEINRIVKRYGCRITNCLAVGFPLPVTASAFIIEIEKVVGRQMA